MRIVPEPETRLPLPDYRLYTPGAPEFATCDYIDQIRATVSGAHYSANDPLAIPFGISEATLISHVGWVNGTTPGGNWDAGIYDRNWKRMCAAGSTVGADANNWQFVSVGGVAIPAGRYYMVVSLDNTTGNRARFYASPGVDICAFMGFHDSSTDAFPLPDPLTNMVPNATNLRIPIIGFMASRAAWT